MKKEYTYLDPDYVYTDPKTGILRNKENLDNREQLIRFESIQAAERLEELRQKPLKIKDSNSLFAVHQYLFQDVYDWAGKARTVEISKGGKPFFPTHHFRQALMYLDTLLAEYRTIPKNELPKIAEKLAVILDTMNFLHSFREGNGRIQREFLRTLALEKGLALNLNPADDADIYERYMNGTINGDVAALTKLIEQLLYPAAHRG